MERKLFKENKNIGKCMDPRVVSSLIGAILFLVMASAPVYKVVNDMGVKNKDLSLVVRSILVGLLMFASLRMLL